MPYPNVYDLDPTNNNVAFFADMSHQGAKGNSPGSNSVQALTNIGLLKSLEITGVTLKVPEEPVVIDGKNEQGFLIVNYYADHSQPSTQLKMTIRLPGDQRDQFSVNAGDIKVNEVQLGEISLYTVRSSTDEIKLEPLLTTEETIKTTLKYISGIAEFDISLRQEQLTHDPNGFTNNENNTCTATYVDFTLLPPEQIASIYMHRANHANKTAKWYKFF